MGVQVGGLVEVQGTVRALVWFFTCMDIDVLSQIVLLVKAFPTELARIA